MKKILKFLKGVKNEMTKVRWSTKKELVKYSIATLTVIVVLMAFFTLTDLGIALVRTLVK